MMEWLKRHIVECGVFTGTVLLILFTLCYTIKEPRIEREPILKDLHAQVIRFNELTVRDKLTVLGRLLVDKIQSAGANLVIYSDTIRAKIFEATSDPDTTPMSKYCAIRPGMLAIYGESKDDAFTISYHQVNKVFIVTALKPFFITPNYGALIRLPLADQMLSNGFVWRGDTITAYTGYLVVDTTGGDTLKCFLNGVWVTVAP